MSISAKEREVNDITTANTAEDYLTALQTFMKLLYLKQKE